jgi:hypothetical protein
MRLACADQVHHDDTMLKVQYILHLRVLDSQRRVGRHLNFAGEMEQKLTKRQQRLFCHGT